MYNPNKLKQFLFLFIVTVAIQALHINAYGQKSTSSPYSRYGIGDIKGKGFSQGFALGGANIALQNDSSAILYINSGNPASYSNMKLTTAELGVNLNRLELKSASSQKTVKNGSVAYLALAFPIKKWWGASVGLTPYSAVGFDVSEQQTISNVGDVNFEYQGDGGINQIYFGNGINPFFGLPKAFTNSKKYERLKLEKKDSIIYKILKRKQSLQNFSLGINASYLFGNINRSQNSIFPFNSNAFDTKTATTTHVGDFFFDYGAQYKYTFDSIKGRRLKENIQLLMGATFSTKTKLTVSNDSLTYSYFTSSAGYEIPKDTINESQGTKGELTLPLAYGFGIGVKIGDRWLLAADYATQNWSNYTFFNKSQGLKNSMRISLGVQYIPNKNANGNWNIFKRINYRIGGRYGLTPIEINGTQLTENAISFGLGIPVSRKFLMQSFSMVNLGVEIGNRGTIENGLIKEQFINTTIGFTINDKWFVKRKYD